MIATDVDTKGESHADFNTAPRRDTPFNYERPDWKPLERAMTAANLPKETCAEFMWMHEWELGHHSYKHRNSRGYVVLTADTDSDVAAERVRKARYGWQSA